MVTWISGSMMVLYANTILDDVPKLLNIVLDASPWKLQS
jgi:hypothetical protein